MTYKTNPHEIKGIISNTFRTVFKENMPSNVKVFTSSRLYDENCLAYISIWNNNTIAARFLNNYRNERLLHEIAVHEAVHIWQEKHKKRDQHGKTFWMWNEKIKQTYGFELKKTYEE